MIQNKKQAFFTSFFICWWSIVAALVLLRISTTVSIVFIHFVELSVVFRSMAIGLANDMLWGLVICFIFAPLIPLFKYRLKLLLIPLLLFVSLPGLGLEKYFINEMTPLGADFWAYSADDIALTLRASAGAGFTLYAGYFVIFCAIVLSVYLIIPLSRSFKTVYIWASVAVLTLAQLAVFFITPGSLQAQYMADNRLGYFINQSITGGASGGNYLAKDLPDYPFEKPFKESGELSRHFKKFATPPNIIFVQVEGLGSQFTGAGSKLAGFTPFLDSLVTKSLYWPNSLSSTGRTFGVVPALYGSLPLATNGFMDLGPDYPAHFTLISWLAQQGYTTSYFYGGNINFDKTDLFLEAQGIKNLIHEDNMGPGYEKMATNKEGFSWGYPDKALFDYYHKLSAASNTPRLDMLMTITTHEPFLVPEAKYSEKFEERLLLKKDKELYTTYRGIFECFLYLDDALKQLFSSLKKRPDWQNTIVVITGDHRVIPLPQQNPLDRFHVPLIIYSPALKKPATFKAVASHAQVAPSFVGLLQHQFQFQVPDNLPFSAGSLPFSTEFESSLSLPLMRNKGELDIFIDGNYLLAGNRLFEVKEGMELEPVANNKIKRELEQQLLQYKARQGFALRNDRLFSGGKRQEVNQFALSDSAMLWLEKAGLVNMLPDSQLVAAQKLATDQDYEHARWAAGYLLNLSPNYTDARILIGRTYAWEGDYDQALLYLREAQKRSPQYEDPYTALADVFYWKQQSDSSLYWAEQGLKKFRDSQELASRRQRAMQ